MPIKQEDIKLLDDLIEDYSGPLVPMMLDLGPHYTSQWTTEDAGREYGTGSADGTVAITNESNDSCGENNTSTANRSNSTTQYRTNNLLEIVILSDMLSICSKQNAF